MRPGLPHGTGRRDRRRFANPGPMPDFPETEIEPLLDNTWGDTAKAIFNNWLGLIYQVTNLDRKQQYMPGVDPDDPLGLKR